MLLIIIAFIGCLDYLVFANFGIFAGLVFAILILPTMSYAHLRQTIYKYPKVWMAVFGSKLSTRGMPGGESIEKIAQLVSSITTAGVATMSLVFIVFHFRKLEGVDDELRRRFFSIHKLRNNRKKINRRQIS